MLNSLMTDCDSEEKLKVANAIERLLDDYYYTEKEVE